MGKLVNKPISVKHNKKIPLEIKLSDICLPVTEVLEKWKDTGAWWDGEKEKTFFRIYVKTQGLCEIYCEDNFNDWILYKIYD